jgi:transcription initiation factor TFIID subunit 3
MDNPFYFSLARISAAQILRAAGIDRTRPSTLDTLTDILIRYLHLLGTQSTSFTLAAGRPLSDIRDVRLAMEDLGIISKGRLVSKKRVRRIARERAGDINEDEDEGEDTDPDGEDEDDESTETLERLLNWFKGPQATECRRVAGATSAGFMNGVTGLSGEQRPSFIAEYVTSNFHFGCWFLMLGLIQKELGKASGIENGTGVSEIVQDGNFLRKSSSLIL